MDTIMSWLWPVPAETPRRPNHGYPCYSINHLELISERVELLDETIEIYAHPSKGGVITLEHAESVDFDYLGLDRLDPTGYRFEDQEQEDEFCQRILLLGAKWWPSAARRDGWFRHWSTYETSSARSQPVEPDFDIRERLWISVGWPSTGGLWVAEYETRAAGDQTNNFPPGSLAHLRLARDMDERCHILRKYFDAKFYKCLDDHDGNGHLRSWNQPNK